MDLSALSTATTGIGALSGLILALPQQNFGYQPQVVTAATPVPPTPTTSASSNGNPQPQPPAFMFDYEGEQTAESESDITDHYSETNIAFQDQIALRPIKVTTHGYVGELNDIPPAFLSAVKSAALALTNISAYTPGLSLTALNAYNEAFYLYQVGLSAVNSAVAAYSSLTGNQVLSKQAKAYNLFFGYQQSRTLFTVQTPWGIFQNMAIEMLRAIQEETTNVISTFEVTFKQMRFATTSTTIPGANQTNVSDNTNYSGRLSAQGASETNLGTYRPPLASQSFSSMLG